MFLVFHSSVAFAATHYVRPGASGAANGSDWTNAWSGLDQVTWTRGDTYYLADGTYNIGRTFDKADSGTTRIFILKATEGAHGTETGWSSAYGDGTATFGGRMLFRSGYWTLDGITGGGPGSWKTGFGFKIAVTGPTSGHGIDADGDIAHHITVAHIEIQGNGGDGVGSPTNDGLFIRGPDFTASYLWIHDTGRTGMFVNDSRFTLSYSWVCCNESTGGQHSQGASVNGGAASGPGPIVDVTFAYVVWEDIVGTGIITMMGTNLQVYGNVFFWTAQRGTTLGNGVIGTWLDNSMINAEIYNNTFINIQSATRSGMGFLGSTSNVVVRNNLWVNSKTPSFSGVTTASHNALYNSGSISQPNIEIVASNPLTNITGEDFTLTIGTAAGVTLSSPFNADPNGTPRGVDGVWDRGAFERNDQQPLSPTNLRLGLQ